MLIGQIEQEILEETFLSYRSKTHSYSATSDYSQGDLQKDEAEAIWRLQRPKLDIGRASQLPLKLKD